ncbi:cutinase [Rhizoctonia solani AG-3 Rhs1AP]|uniref:Cutinase n=2 Tax=Rhizoctonia solani AG-3 TaxID=1086053 RepID=X8JF30_9AGAM|nr:cutinase [Rhizoctonia solani AG-3 Rhs1AP]
MAVQHLIKQWALCPDQHYVIGGYSKGAMVIHSMNLPHYLKVRVLSVVVFGDPFHIAARSWPIYYPIVNLTPKSGFSISQNVVSFCNPGDIICRAGARAKPHRIYEEDGR